ncbi:MAG: VOC family protein [Xanthobacteraceae bacterium]
MSTAIAPIITDLVQVCVVVRDLDATMKSYVEVAGIGPWAVYDFGPPDVSKILVRGKPATFRVRLALTWTKDRMWEIIQPLEGHSPYQEFLDERGEGMHHTLVQHAGHKFDEVVGRFRAQGCAPLMTYEFRGTRIAIIDTVKELKMYVEVIERPAGAPVPPKRPPTPPAYWYPAGPPPDHNW